MKLNFFHLPFAHCYSAWKKNNLSVNDFFRPFFSKGQEETKQSPDFYISLSTANIFMRNGLQNHTNSEIVFSGV
jgi:hypothetical protein